MEQNKETIKENAPKLVASVIGGTTATQVGAAGWWAYLSTAGSGLLQAASALGGALVTASPYIIGGATVVVTSSYIYDKIKENNHAAKQTNARGGEGGNNNGEEERGVIQVGLGQRDVKLEALRNRQVEIREDNDAELNQRSIITNNSNFSARSIEVIAWLQEQLRQRDLEMEGLRNRPVETQENNDVELSQRSIITNNSNFSARSMEVIAGLQEQLRQRDLEMEGLRNRPVEIQENNDVELNQRSSNADNSNSSRTSIEDIESAQEELNERDLELEARNSVIERIMDNSNEQMLQVNQSEFIMISGEDAELSGESNYFIVNE